MEHRHPVCDVIEHWHPVGDVIEPWHPVCDVMEHRHPVCDVIEHWHPVCDVIGHWHPVCDVMEHRHPVCDVIEHWHPVGDVIEPWHPVCDVMEHRHPVCDVIEHWHPVCDVIGHWHPVCDVMEHRHPVCDVIEHWHPVGDVIEPWHPVCDVMEHRHPVCDVIEHWHPVCDVIEHWHPVCDVMEHWHPLGYKTCSLSPSYPTRPGHEVLRSFDLRIPHGKTVALVGQSGGGKSTVAALLERFYDPTEGAVQLDGVDIRILDPSWLRGEVIGFINQEPVLFGTTIIENIRFGRPDATDAEVHEAAIQANADSFIRSFPEGYNTMLGERGVTLSGGQKQRVAIARALLKDPKILILDEATSALDTESERAVQVALDRARSGRTVLVIAHRLSTISEADFIVVLSKGQVAEVRGADWLP
eukprot:XP_017950320.1 PREDICTED: ATP-binding cassette sub-family B member 8, mitochondrial-like [Xenopus tropicalis]